MSRKRKRRTTSLTPERVNEHLQANADQEVDDQLEEDQDEQVEESMENKPETVECCSASQQESEEYCCCSQPAPASNLAAPIFAGFVLVLLALVAMSIVGYKKAIAFKNEIRQEVNANQQTLSSLQYEINAQLTKLQDITSKQSSSLTAQNQGLEDSFSQISSQMDAKFADLTGNIKDVLNKFAKDHKAAMAPVTELGAKVDALQQAMDEMKSAVLTANITSQRKSQLMQNAIAAYQADLQSKLDAQAGELKAVAGSAAGLDGQLREAESFITSRNAAVIEAVQQAWEGNQAVLQKINVI